MWNWFVQLLFMILKSIENVTGDWGLAIIVLTIIIRILIMPLMTKSTASSAKMQALQPRMKQIQEQYADNPAKQAEEMQKFYAENKFNPLGGCLPLILQMPIFFGLFTMIRTYVPEDAHFYNILPSLSESARSALSNIGMPDAIVYIILVIAFGVLTLIPMLMNSKNTPEEQRGQSLMMGVVMAIMMVWIGWGLPAAVNLYYDASAIWQVVQQKVVTQRVMDKVKAETAAKLEAQGQKTNIEVIRREKKKRPRKKS